MNRQRAKLGIIGCGKMASAMLARWLDAGTLQPDEVLACTATEASASRVAQQFGVACGTDAQDVIDNSGIVLLAVKPQMRTTALANLQPRPDQRWLSVLAGVTTVTLEAMLPGAHVIRLMPNTPVRLGRGVVAMTRGATANKTDVAGTRALLAPLGTVVDVAEPQVDAFTAVAGSGPAYVFLFTEALTDAGVAQGLDPTTAALLARETVLGAAVLAQQSNRPPAELRAEVTSKGGMTQAALEVFAARDWAPTVTAAVAAAVARAAELAKN
jgi:pyrroline-5-carboxylate reductase